MSLRFYAFYLSFSHTRHSHDLSWNFLCVFSAFLIYFHLLRSLYEKICCTHGLSNKKKVIKHIFAVYFHAMHIHHETKKDWYCLLRSWRYGTVHDKIIFLYSLEFDKEPHRMKIDTQWVTGNIFNCSTFMLVVNASKINWSQQEITFIVFYTCLRTTWNRFNEIFFFLIHSSGRELRREKWID